MSLTTLNNYNNNYIEYITLHYMNIMASFVFVMPPKCMYDIFIGIDETRVGSENVCTLAAKNRDNTILTN